MELEAADVFSAERDDPLRFPLGPIQLLMRLPIGLPAPAWAATPNSRRRKRQLRPRGFATTRLPSAMPGPPAYQGEPRSRLACGHHAGVTSQRLRASSNTPVRAGEQ